MQFSKVLDCGAKHAETQETDTADTVVSREPAPAEYHAGKNVYLPVFCFEGLISEFPKFTYRFPSLRASFSSQVKKNVGHRIYSWGAVFQSGKNTILFHFLNFFCL